MTDMILKEVSLLSLELDEKMSLLRDLYTDYKRIF